MKIASVKGIKLRCPCAEISDALGTSTARQAFLIKIETDNGLVGIGEAFTYGAPLDAMQAILEQQMIPILLGEEASDIERLWQTMYWRTIASGRRSLTMGVISGIDTALWDLLGKASNMPISKLLGKQFDCIPTYASGGFYAPEKTIEDLGKEIAGYLKKGYRDAKIKIGRTLDRTGAPLQYMANQRGMVTIEEDWNRIKLAKSLLGKGKLIVDTNASWSASKTVQMGPELLDMGVSVIEEPIPFEDIHGYQHIKQSIPKLLVAGCETQQGLPYFSHMIESDCLDIVQPDVGWAGGISEVKKIGNAAQAAGKSISLHCFGSAVLFAASLQVASAMGNTIAMESEENPNPLKEKLLKTNFETDHAMNFKVPDDPGLGIELNWDAVDSFVVR
ncbi:MULTISPECIES: mandelate racemase/muconate lactonizing enzyme family protein [Acidaminococcus]|jgi:D-galactarolactone cycloisomerase|uniref:mandelate racemase/muconate lactonizing enzyme family protein n=1 Tax=Acidaminococcus TaxID=904 RepID=UPI000E745311|nr:MULTISPECIES: mandelate racemase/muconate lactonizing enzyme family protein [Acidaminococcus]RJU36582.1 mandelate racemase/muconate lactonizing enzyme family protein [Acidaminococcus sp. AM33-14BH]